MLASGSNAHEVLHKLDLTGLGLDIPEHDAVLHTFRLVKGVDDRVGEEAPAVVGADARKVDEVVHGQGEAERAELPGHGRQRLALHAQRPQVLTKRRVKLHDVFLDEESKRKGVCGGGEGRARQARDATHASRRCGQGATRERPGSD